MGKTLKEPVVFTRNLQRARNDENW